ncbi:MAG: hypothetical protein JOZ78_09380 [Chroococcidiopsidaceae cyanobacterium CP_BM_ER_R8_30]|nr:hypothetical protein [Chroococcidiopsidaceae cyanobacterium CP_BM_ER_R8_30]
MSESGSTEPNIALFTLSGLIMVLGLLSGFIKERLFLSEPMVAVLVGALVGPSVLGFIDLASWGKPETILEQGSRLAIAMQVMGVALSQRHTGLESTWVVGSLLICASIFAHGITAVPLAKLYGNRVQSTKI